MYFFKLCVNSIECVLILNNVFRYLDPDGNSQDGPLRKKRTKFFSGMHV